MLARLETDEGEGWGECVADVEPGYSEEFNEGAWLVVRDHLAPALLRAGDLSIDDLDRVFAHVRGNPASPRRLIGMCAGCPRRWPGVGYVPSRRGPCVVGCEHALGAAANVCGGLAWWRWRGSGSLRWGVS